MTHATEVMALQIVSFGGGTNSTAMLVGLYERGERPDYIVFSDTGSEKPHTYQHIIEVNEWLEKIGFPPIITVRGSQPQQLIDGSLHGECLRLGVMPSKAYGFGKCSLKWKVEPNNKFARGVAAKRGINHKDIVRLIGFDADEPNRVDRAMRVSDVPQRFPLVEWGWGREECVEAISRAGLSQPGKSACFMCPSSKKKEIIELRNRYPELLAIALKIERVAVDGSGQAPAFNGKGLGRSFAWGDVVAAEEAQLCMFSDAGTPEVDCGCYDGD